MAGRIIEVEVGEQMKAPGQGPYMHVSLAVLRHPGTVPVGEKQIERVVGVWIFRGESRERNLGRCFLREANAEFSAREQRRVGGIFGSAVENADGKPIDTESQPGTSGPKIPASEGTAVAERPGATGRALVELIAVGRDDQWKVGPHARIDGQGAHPR